ncbi:MAG: PKD domain-containing protein [Methanosarcina sp.]
MKTKINLHSFTLTSIALVFFLILVSSVASASITETRITNHGTASYPAIYGNTIVWQDERNGNWDVYIYDLSTKKEIHTTNSAYQTDPDIYENSVVWIDNRNGWLDIYLQDLATKKQTCITTNGEASTPEIYGNKIVYVKDADHENETWYDLYMYDISTKKETKIPTIVSAHAPQVYGNKIVWLDFDGLNLGFEEINGNQIVCVYDLSTKKQTQIVKADFLSEGIDTPDIYGNRIVYAAFRNRNWDIYMYDLSTKKETRITTNTSDSINPVIYGNNIVWQDNRNRNWDIYAYNLTTHQQVHTTSKSIKDGLAIYDDKVVWTDYRNGGNKPDIYMGTISYLPVADFIASPTSGIQPLNVQFNDKSTDVYYWSWDFGDKTTSTLQSPAHKYAKAGKYTVTLTVKNAAGKNSMKKTNYITVK